MLEQFPVSDESLWLLTPLINSFNPWPILVKPASRKRFAESVHLFRNNLTRILRTVGEFPIGNRNCIGIWAVTRMSYGYEMALSLVNVRTYVVTEECGTVKISVYKSSYLRAQTSDCVDFVTLTRSPLVFACLCRQWKICNKKRNVGHLHLWGGGWWGVAFKIHAGST